MSVRFLLLSLILVVGLISCNEEPLQTPEQESVQNESSQLATAEIEEILHTHTAILASDEFEGRAPATPGEDKTINYLRDQFLSLGIGPGNGDSYFQSVAVTELTTSSNAFIYMQGSDYEATFNYGDQVMVGTQQQIPYVTVQGSDVVFVGYGIVAPERNWIRYSEP